MSASIAAGKENGLSARWPKEFALECQFERRCDVWLPSSREKLSKCWSTEHGQPASVEHKTCRIIDAATSTVFSTPGVRMEVSGCLWEEPWSWLWAIGPSFLEVIGRDGKGRKRVSEVTIVMQREVGGGWTWVYWNEKYEEIIHVLARSTVGNEKGGARSQPAWCGREHET